jgi:hypothetical protein
MSKFGLDGAVGPRSDVWASQDRVTICRMEQDPHPVLRRIFQAGGREPRDMIRNSARCNRDEVGEPARNATCLGIISRIFVRAPSRSVAQVQSSRQYCKPGYSMPAPIKDCCHPLVIRPAAATPFPADVSPFRLIL